MAKEKSAADKDKIEIDDASKEVYSALGYTHVVSVPARNRFDPDGYKVVKQHEKSGKYVDENGQEYDDAQAFE